MFLFIKKFLEKFENVLLFLTVVCLLVIIFDVFIGVIARYVFNNSFQWTEELGVLFYTWLIFLGFPIGLNKGNQVSIGIVYDNIPDSWRYILDYFIGTIIVTVLVTLLLNGWEIYKISSGLLPGLQWPNSIRYFLIPISASSALVFFVFSKSEKFIDCLKNIYCVILGLATYFILTNLAKLEFTSISPSIVMCIVVLSSLIIGVPIVYSLLIGAFFATWTGDLLPAPAVVHNIVTGGSKFVLLAIPFFLTAGYLMNTGGLTDRLIRLALCLVGHLKGGLAQVNVVTSLLLGGLSGSSSADAAGTSRVLVPSMVKEGYSVQFSAALTASSSILANIIPPSIAMLIYASLSEVSVGRLFLAGIIPGIMLACSMMFMNYFLAIKRNYIVSKKRSDISEFWSSLKGAATSLFLPVLIIGSIRFGVMTPTEAGVVAVLWAFYLGKYLYSQYGWKDCYQTLKNCALDTSMIGFLISAAVPFAWVLIAEQIPQKLIFLTLDATNEKLMILILMNIIFLLLGTILDTVASMLIVVPLFLPLMVEIGVDPIHFGIILIINLMIGNITPPIGLLVFITSAVTKTNPSLVFKEIIPYLFVLFFSLLIITFFPEITLLLSR